MRRKALFIVLPAGLLALVAAGVRVHRTPYSRDDFMARRPATSPSRETPTRRAVVTHVTSAPPIAPPAPILTGAEEGHALHSSGLQKQLAVYIRASLEGDEPTRKAILQGLSAEPRESRAVTQKCLAHSKTIREREILENLLRGLP